MSGATRISRRGGQTWTKKTRAATLGCDNGPIASSVARRALPLRPTEQRGRSYVEGWRGYFTPLSPRALSPVASHNARGSPSQLGLKWYARSGKLGRLTSLGWPTSCRLGAWVSQKVSDGCHSPVDIYADLLCVYVVRGPGGAHRDRSLCGCRSGDEGAIRGDALRDGYHR